MANYIRKNSIQLQSTNAILKKITNAKSLIKIFYLPDYLKNSIQEKHLNWIL